MLMTGGHGLYLLIPTAKNPTVDPLPLVPATYGLADAAGHII